jgi:predicted secreted protein
MPLTFVFFIYLNSWLVSLFVVLPFFVRTEARAQKGEYEAAPRAINWRRALRVNSLVAVCVTSGLVWLITSGLINVKNVIN